MKLQVTIDIFSGRENPSFSLQGRDASRFADQIQFGAAMKADIKDIERPSQLGYRGIRIEQTDKRKSKSLPEIINLHGSFAITEKKILQVDNFEKIEDMLFKRSLKKKVAKSINGFEKVLKSEVGPENKTLNVEPGIFQKVERFNYYRPDHLASSFSISMSMRTYLRT